MIWVAKYRRKTLNPDVVGYIRRFLLTLLRKTPGVEIKQAGIAIDHVHFVMVFPPKYLTADIMGDLKIGLHRCL